METPSLRVPLDSSFFSCYRRMQQEHVRCKYPETMTETFFVLMRFAGVRIEGIEQPLARLDDVLQLIYNKSVETTAVALSPIPERLQHSKASDSIRAWDEKVFALAADQSSPDLSYTAFKSLMVYDTWIWIIFALVFALTKLYRWTHQQIKNSRLNESLRAPHKSHTFHLLIVGYFMMLFGGLYGNGLLARLLSERKVLPFNNYDEMIELIESGKLRVIGTSPSMAYWSRDIESALRLNTAFKNDAQSVIWSYTITPALDQMITSGEVVWIGRDLSILEHHARLCGTRIVQLPEMGTTRNGLLFATNVSDHLISRINAAIHQSHSALMTIAERYVEMKLKEIKFRCSKQANNSNNSKPAIGLLNALGSFAFFTVGMTIALSMLVLERYWPWRDGFLLGLLYQALGELSDIG